MDIESCHRFPMNKNTRHQNQRIIVKFELEALWSFTRKRKLLGKKTSFIAASLIKSFFKIFLPILPSSTG